MRALLHPVLLRSVLSPFAAHGYGPVLPEGAELIRPIDTLRLEINDSAFQFCRRGPRP